MPRVTAKDPVVKLAHKRLSILELVQELGSVSKACKQADMDRLPERPSPRAMPLRNISEITSTQHMP